MATQEGNPLALVEELRLRANQDEGLKARLLADPHATIESETGIKIPGGWVIAATSLADGTVNVDLANEEIPEEYLELISGGRELPPSSTDPGSSGC
jgi:hypothetical protein